MEDAKKYSVYAAVEVIEIPECFDLSLKILELHGKHKTEESSAPAINFVHDYEHFVVLF